MSCRAARARHNDGRLRRYCASFDSPLEGALRRRSKFGAFLGAFNFWGEEKPDLGGVWRSAAPTHSVCAAGTTVGAQRRAPPAGGTTAPMKAAAEPLLDTEFRETERTVRVSPLAHVRVRSSLKIARASHRRLPRRRASATPSSAHCTTSADGWRRLSRSAGCSTRTSTARIA